MLYGESMLGPDSSFPAIVDTGSSTLGVPSQLFDALKEQWKNDVGKNSTIDCKTDDNFCQVTE
jgi:hypothetical protein